MLLLMGLFIVLKVSSVVFFSDSDFFLESVLISNIIQNYQSFFACLESVSVTPKFFNLKSEVAV